MISNYQRFYRRSLENIEYIINARACGEPILNYYEFQRRFILKQLLKWQIKEFDRS